ncbi:MAG: polymer-forming cytoskeletal protein, partial [Akkermansia sp.]|nr:polymer-forming cytoskeletal protein [Akkermansia sp.]
MFKYPQKPAAPTGGSPFAENDVPDEWAAPVQQPAASDAGYFGAEETTASPFDTGAAMPASGPTRNVLNYDVSVVGTLRFTDDLLVDGSVEGEITSDGVLTVGANASIQAGEKNKVAVRTQSAIIHGKVVGDIVVTDRVELAATAEVV